MEGHVCNDAPSLSLAPPLSSLLLPSTHCFPASLAHPAHTIFQQFSNPRLPLVPASNPASAALVRNAPRAYRALYAALLRCIVVVPWCHHTVRPVLRQVYDYAIAEGVKSHRVVTLIGTVYWISVTVGRLLSVRASTSPLFD